MSLSAILDAAQPVPGGFSVEIPPTWHQGRTAYGGLSSALSLVAAMRAGGADLPPLRSTQVSMIAPVFGTVEVTAQVVRRGKNAHWIEARITREGETGFIASFVFMSPTASELHLDNCVPDGVIVPLDEAQPLPAGLGVTFLANHFDVRFARPRSAEPHPELFWWVRPREREGLNAMVALLLTADALPPAVIPLIERGTPVSSMHWQASLLTPEPITRDGWWLMQSAADFAERGCSSQRMRVWNADAKPVMAGMQSVAVFG